MLEFGDEVDPAAVTAVLSATLRLNGRYTFGELKQRFYVSKQSAAGTECEPRYPKGVREKNCTDLRVDEMWLVAPDWGDGEDVVIWRARLARSGSWDTASFTVQGRSWEPMELSPSASELGTHAASCLQKYLEHLQTATIKAVARPGVRRGLRLSGLA